MKMFAIHSFVNIAETVGDGVGRWNDRKRKRYIVEKNWNKSGQCYSIVSLIANKQHPLNGIE